METNLPVSTTTRPPSNTNGFERTFKSYPLSSDQGRCDAEDQYHTISHMLYSCLYENSNITSQKTPIACQNDRFLALPFVR